MLDCFAVLLLGAVPAAAQFAPQALTDAAVLRSEASLVRPKAPPPEPKERLLPRFQQKRFPAPPAGACGLKSFTVQDYEARSRDGAHERSRITVMGAVLETTAPGCLREFGVVQFIRGCAYHSRYDLRTGALLERVFDVARRLRGVRVVFSHPDFEVDTNDEDPLYSGSPEEEDRLALAYVPAFPLRLRPDRASLLHDLPAFDDPSRRTFLKDHPEPTSVLFVSDVPDGGVSFSDEEEKTLSAEETSLDFKTCLYRLQDVPAAGTPTAEPLQCFRWASRYNYDPVLGDFVTDRFQGVDPFCSQAPARVPLPQ